MSGPEHTERGSSALEYVALVLVAAMLLTAIGLQSGSPTLERVRVALCQAIGTILHQDRACGAPSHPQTTADFKPPTCKVTDNGTKASVAVKIGFVKIGQDIGLVRTTYSDGSVKITVTNGATLGATGGFGAEAKLGDAFEAGAKVDFGGGATVANGSSWTFKDKAEADAMEQQLNDYLAMQEADRDAAINGALIPPSLLHHVDPPKDPSEQITEVSGQAKVSSYLGIKIKAPAGTGQTYEHPGADVEGSHTGEAKWIIKDLGGGTTSYTTDMSYAPDISGTITMASGGASAKVSGAVTVKVKDGNIVGLTITTVVDNASYAKPGGSQKGSQENGEVDKKGKPKKDSAGGTAIFTSQEGTSSVVTTDLTVDEDDTAAQQTIRDWLGGSGDQWHPVTAATKASIDLTSPGPRSAFDQLLYDRARVSMVDYDTSKKGGEFALEVKLGAALGISGEFSETQSRSTSASYLGAPTAQGRTAVSFDDCVAK